MYFYALLNGLSKDVSLVAFHKSSKSGPYKKLFDESLHYLKVAEKDFNSLRATKQLRNSAFYSYDYDESMMIVLKPTTVPEFKIFADIVTKYPKVFDITNSEATMNHSPSYS